MLSLQGLHSQPSPWLLKSPTGFLKKKPIYQALPKDKKSRLGLKKKQQEIPRQILPWYKCLLALFFGEYT